jgi:hypothetical protein
MAMKRDAKTPVKVKKDIRHRVLVEEGRHPMFGDPIPHSYIHKETVESLAKAKERKAELEKEYPGKSVFYFSI